MNGILSDVYLGCMIIGNFFEKNLKHKITEDDFIDLDDWNASEECATFAETVFVLANNVNISMESAARTVFDMIREVDFRKVTDHQWDEYTRGFLAGQVLGIPTEDAKKKAERAEEIWFDSSNHYGYYQEVLNDLEGGD